MSYNRVREALPASQRCSAPPVSRQISHESTVPSRTSSIGTPFGRWSNIQRILGAENIGSTRRPLRSCTSCRSWSLKLSLHHAVVRRSCHPMTGPSGCAAAGAPADDRFPLGRERDAYDLGVRQRLAGRRPLPPARWTRCAPRPARPIQDAERKRPTGRCRHGPVGRPRRSGPLSNSSSPGRSPRSTDRLERRHRFSSHRLRAILLRAPWPSLSKGASSTRLSAHLLRIDELSLMIDYAVANE